MGFLIFLVSFFLIYFGMHYFIYHRVANGFSLTGSGLNYARAFFIVASLTFIFDIFLRRQFFIYPVAWFGAIWTGVMSISFAVMVLKLPFDFFLPNRKKELTVCAFILIAAITGFSLYNESRPPVVKEVRVKMQNLPSNLSGFTVIHLSDLQLSRLDDVEKLRSLVERVNALSGDLIVITGDIFDEPLDDLTLFMEPFKKLSAKHGVIAIAGNHEHYTGVEDFKKFAKAAGMKTLINSSTQVAGAIEVIGLDDSTGRSYKEPGEILKPLIKSVGSDKPVIFLSHKPYYFEQAADLGVDLQLSGHTHSGQIPPFDLIVWLMFKYSYGLYNYKSSYIYTTCGSGTWGPPMRFLSRSEIVKIILE